MRRAALVLACVVVFGLIRYGSLGEPEPVVDRASPEWKLRQQLLERAAVFVPGQPKPVKGFAADPPVRCTFVPKPIRGTTPKFDCRLESGEVVKVKYGANPEVPAEIGATRLLALLGFGADHVSHVNDIQCAGCPPHPFRSRQLAEMLFAEGIFERLIDVNHVRHFDHVAIERKFEAAPIRTGEFAGWEWSDLEHVQEAEGGASRAELDALRLIAVLLGHWDNKPSNQRLVCLDRVPRGTSGAGDRACRQPLLMLQDLGATFGPRKLNHANWTKTPLFEAADSCVLTMASLPYNGSTFRRVEISEAGRLLFLARIQAVSDAQLQSVFLGAGFPDPATGEPRTDDVSPWVATLKKKVVEIASRSCTET